MSPNRFLILFLLPLLAACPAKSKSPLLFLGEMSASASLPTDWVQDAYLKASNAGAGDAFGKTVAIDGDIAVVGAPGEDNSSAGIINIDNAEIIDDGAASNAGAVYVFKRDSAGNWQQDAYLKASNAGANDYFGSSVSISGNTVVVGAYGEDNSASDIDNMDNIAITDVGTATESGAVYVFKRDNSGNWVQDAYLKASNTGGGDCFGKSVGIANNTIVAGAPLEDNGSTTISNTNNTAITDVGTATESGAVYVFKRDNSGDWVQDAYLKASNAETDDYFGESVAISGDTIIVGVQMEDNSSSAINNADNATILDESLTNDSGAAYVFKKDATGDWHQDAYLKATNPGSSNYFGMSVAIAGTTIVVGARGESVNSTAINNADNPPSSGGTTGDFVGAVYIFKRDASGDWNQDAYLKASNAEANDNFGTAAIDLDIVVIGASGEGNASTAINNVDNVAIVDSGMASGSGAAYVFKKDTGGNWIQDAYIKASNADTGNQFGLSAISDNTIIISAWREDNSSTFITNDDNATIIDEGTATESGAAYIFTLK